MRGAERQLNLQYWPEKRGRGGAVIGHLTRPGDTDQRRACVSAAPPDP